MNQKLSVFDFKEFSWVPIPAPTPLSLSHSLSFCVNYSFAVLHDGSILGIEPCCMCYSETCFFLTQLFRPWIGSTFSSFLTGRTKKYIKTAGLRISKNALGFCSVSDLSGLICFYSSSLTILPPPLSLCLPSLSET